MSELSDLELDLEIHRMEEQRSVTPRGGVTTIRDAVRAFRAYQDRGNEDRLPFGIPLIDRATNGGVEPGELVTFLGRTASLKTMAVQNVCRQLVKRWKGSLARPEPSSWWTVSPCVPAATLP